MPTARAEAATEPVSCRQAMKSHCVCSVQPPRRLRRRGTGVKSIGSGWTSTAPADASKSAALSVTG